MTGTLHEVQSAFVVIPPSALLGLRKVLGIDVVEKIKTHILCQIMWKNMVEPDRAPTTVWRMRIACWITNFTYTHSEYVTLTACLFLSLCFFFLAFFAYFSLSLSFSLFSHTFLLSSRWYVWLPLCFERR